MPEICPVVPADAVPKIKTAPAMMMAAPRTNLSRGRRNMLASSVDPPNRQTEGSIPDLDRTSALRSRSLSDQPQRSDLHSLNPCPMCGHPSPGQPRNLSYRLCRVEPPGLVDKGNVAARIPEAATRGSKNKLRTCSKFCQSLFRAKNWGHPFCRVAPEPICDPRMRAAMCRAGPLVVVRGRGAGERRRPIARETVAAREREFLVQRHVDVQVVPADAGAEVEVERGGPRLVDRRRVGRPECDGLGAIADERAVRAEAD